MSYARGCAGGEVKSQRFRSRSDVEDTKECQRNQCHKHFYACLFQRETPDTALECGNSFNSWENVRTGLLCGGLLFCTTIHIHFLSSLVLGFLCQLVFT